MDRRDFLKKSGLSLAGLSLAGIPFDLFANDFSLYGNRANQLTILHTNDVHSRIEPFEHGRNAGLGGVARRASLIENIRKEGNPVLLLDAGDIFQGTPYFNFFDGELEMKLMSKLGYDAATIGNHDFDAGIDGLEKQLVHTNFPLVISNYDFSDTVMHNKTRETYIIKKGDYKIGIFGFGIELDGLVPKELYKATQYKNPLPIANEIAGRLKHDENCDFVICLSHLGYQYQSKKVSDMIVAEQSKDIDLIIGGHTHTFLNEPTAVKNAEGKKMLINQVGFAGINLGRIDVFFSNNKDQRLVKSAAIPVK